MKGKKEEIEECDELPNYEEALNETQHGGVTLPPTYDEILLLNDPLIVFNFRHHLTKSKISNKNNKLLSTSNLYNSFFSLSIHYSRLIYHSQSGHWSHSSRLISHKRLLRREQHSDLADHRRRLCLVRLHLAHTSQCSSNRKVRN